MTKETPVQDVGMLIHGRHLQAVSWEGMVWGYPEANRMGTLPTAALAILDEGVDGFARITMGSGGSVNSEGVSEAEVTRNLFLDRFEELDAFEPIRTHPRWDDDHPKLRKLFKKANLDTESTNTQYEVGRAAILFTELDVKKVLQVTSLDHGGRCLEWQGIARAEGFIPNWQRWHLITDEIPFLGGIAGQGAILEVPHRGDDETLKWDYSLWPSTLMKDYRRLPSNRRQITAMMMRHLIDQVGSMNDTSFAEMQSIMDDTEDK